MRHSRSFIMTQKNQFLFRTGHYISDFMLPTASAAGFLFVSGWREKKGNNVVRNDEILYQVNTISSRAVYWHFPVFWCGLVQRPCSWKRLHITYCRLILWAGARNHNPGFCLRCSSFPLQVSDWAMVTSEHLFPHINTLSSTARLLALFLLDVLYSLQTNSDRPSRQEIFSRTKACAKI